MATTYLFHHEIRPFYEPSEPIAKTRLYCQGFNTLFFVLDLFTKTR